MSENITQKRLKILEYFDAYICHHYQPRPQRESETKILFNHMLV